jgi:hypothetical protein
MVASIIAGLLDSFVIMAIIAEVSTTTCIGYLLYICTGIIHTLPDMSRQLEL